MKKKLLAAIMAMAMVVPALGMSASADEANKLTVWCWDPSNNMYSMEKAAEIYKEVNPDFELDLVEVPWDDLQTKVITAATSGDLSTLPDIFLMQDNAFQKNVIMFPGLITPLTDSGIDFAQFGEAKTAYSVIDGVNYGIPFDNGAVIACYRTDILAEAGYTVDDLTDITWSRYAEIGKDVLEKTGKPLLSGVAGQVDIIMMMVQSAGGSLFDAEGNPSIVGNEILKEVITTYAQMVKDGVVIEVNDWDQYIGTMVNSTVAGTINGCWIMGSIQTAEDQSGNWAITNMPRLEVAENATNYSNNGGSSWAISANCDNPEVAYEFMKHTYAGSVPLYEDIISVGMLATYLPVGDSPVYGESVEFYGGDAIYGKILEFSTHTPSNFTGAYYYEARDAVAVAATNFMNGADMDAELEVAQNTVNFAMGR